jgi:hypothetical protein
MNLYKLIPRFYDTLLYQGMEYEIFSSPLGAYLDKTRPELKFILTTHTIGHIETWEIVDDKIYLTATVGTARITDIVQYRLERLRLRQELKQGLITPQENGRMLKKIMQSLTKEVRVNLETLFPGQKRVFADWINGTIDVPYGKLFESDEEAYVGVYKEKIMLQFKNGILVDTRIVKCIMNISNLC